MNLRLPAVLAISLLCAAVASCSTAAKKEVRLDRPADGQAAAISGGANPEREVDGGGDRGDRFAGSPIVTEGDEIAAAALPPRDGDRVYPAGAEIPELPEILFEYDTDSLSESAKAAVAKAAEVLKRRPELLVVLRGHTDDRGTPEYNMALGSRRALAVQAALLEAGIAADRIDTLSFGEELPADPADSEEARAKNRRVEFFVFERQ